MDVPTEVLASVVTGAISMGVVYGVVRARMAALEKLVGELDETAVEHLKLLHQRQVEATQFKGDLEKLQSVTDERTRALDKLESTVDRSGREVGKTLQEVRDRLSKTKTWSQEMPAARDSRAELPSDEPPPMRPRLPSIQRPR